MIKYCRHYCDKDENWFFYENQMKPYLAKDGLNCLSFTTNRHWNLDSIILCWTWQTVKKNNPQDKSYISTNDNFVGNIDNIKSNAEYSVSAK